VTIKSEIPAVAVVPYGKWSTLKLASTCLDQLEWPIGRPQRLMKGTISDLRSDDNLITFPRKPVFFLPRFGVKAKISIMIVEPQAVHKIYMNFSKFLSWRFYKVLTINEVLLEQIKNGEFFYFGSTFIKNIHKKNIHKNKLASIIASARHSLEGHKLRHEIIEHIRNTNTNINIMGRGYKPFEHKEDGLIDYQYSIIIENVREKDYFTEKLVDACLCETIPIYWGAPNISDYFDPRGLIICNSIEDIKNALNQMSTSDYNSRIKWINKNKKSALYHADYIKRAAELIRDSLTENKNKFK